MGGESGGIFDFPNLDSAGAGAGVNSTFHHQSKEEAADAKGIWLFDGMDPLEYRPWKRWVQADLMQMDDTEANKKKKGPRVYKMLRGEARTALDAYEVEAFNIEGGELLIFAELDVKYPDHTAVEKKIQ